MAENKGIDQLTPLTDLLGDVSFEVFDNDEAGVGVLKNKRASVATVKAPVSDSLTPTATTALAIAANADEIDISLTANWAPTTITGLVKGKTVALRISTDGLAAYPYQITWPANISFNDGVEPVLSNNNSAKYDWVYLQGIDDTNNGQVKDVMLAG